MSNNSIDSNLNTVAIYGSFILFIKPIKIILIIQVQSVIAYKEINLLAY